MIEKYVYGAHAIIVAYDITNSASFEDVSEWVTTIKKIMKNAEKVNSGVTRERRVDFFSDARPLFTRKQG